MATLLNITKSRIIRVGLMIVGVMLIPILVIYLGSRSNGTPQGVGSSNAGSYAEPTAIPLSWLIPPSHAEVAPPPGAVSFCLRNPEQCRSAKGSATSILLTPAHWLLIERINSEVNSAIRPQGDISHYDRAEYWIVPIDGYGDCEDYALTKQKRLLDAGFPLAALRLAIVVTARGNRHAVLTVTTSGGDYVLDNLNALVMPWAAAQLAWLMRQDLHDPWGWSRMGNGSDIKGILLTGPVSSTCQ